jgi:hypothetical protein
MRIWGIKHPASNAEIVADQNVLRSELNQAYRRGRRDERLSRRRSPMAMAALVAMALIGAVVLFTAARQGSFANGGDAIDSQLGHAANVTAPALANDAADRAGAVMKDAGRRLKEQGARTGNEAEATPSAG